MTHKKIVHLTSVHPATDVRIFHKECQTLARGGYQVVLIAPHDQDEVVNNVRIQALPKPKNRWDRITRTVWATYQAARKEQALLYHFHDPELIPAGLGLRLLGKKVIYDIHEDVPRSLYAPSKDYLPPYLKKPISWFIEWFEDLAARWFSGLITATPIIEQRFQRLNSQTKTINNFPILDEFANMPVTWNERSPSVAYVGIISIERGLYQMVKAMEYIPTQHRARLKLAGIFSPSRIYNNAVKLPGWQYVDELGFLDRQGVAQLLNNVSAGLVLFHPESNHVQAQPNKIFEYMAAGIPVIASDFPLWRNIIETAGCGLLIDPLDSKAIAAAIEYILTHPTEAEAMGRRGRQAVEQHYNWQIEQAKLLQLYADLIGAPEM